MRKLPRHIHYPEESSPSYQSVISINWIPVLDWTKMAFQTWEAFKTGIGLVAQNLVDTIGSIIKTIYDAGVVAWNQISKTASDVVSTIANWANIITSFGAWTAGQILGVLTSWTQMTSGMGSIGYARLEAVPYKLPTSAYNYIVNPSFEYGTWGGDETVTTVNPKFGKQYVTLTASGTNKSSGYSNFIDIRGLIYFSISVWLVGVVTTPYFVLQIYFYKVDKTACSPNGNDIEMISTDQSVWTQHTRIYNVSTELPSDCTFVRLRFSWWNSSGNPNGWMDVDGWQLNVGDQIPAFQDFTTYSFNWTPDKIETASSTQTAWSSTDWTNALELSFTTDSKMLLLIHAFVDIDITTTTTSAEALLKLTMDGTDLVATMEHLGHMVANSFYGGYASHTVFVVEKGSHTLRMAMKACLSGVTVYATDRRLSILESFYQGGAT